VSGRQFRLPVVVAAVVLLAGLAGALALDGPLLDSSSSTNVTDDGTATQTDPDATNTTDAPAAGSGPESDGAGGGDAGSSGGDGASGGDGGTDDTGDPAPATFLFTVDDTEKCGTTCRDVTVSVRNRGGTAAESVDVDVRILADGDELWAGSQSFPAVEAGETKTRTERVNLGFVDGAKIKANDGYITIETTIAWDGGQESFSERRKVA
jgi:hypothetical protein